MDRDVLIRSMYAMAEFTAKMGRMNCINIARTGIVRLICGSATQIINALRILWFAMDVPTVEMQKTRLEICVVIGHVLTSSGNVGMIYALNRGKSAGEVISVEIILIKIQLCAGIGIARQASGSAEMDFSVSKI